MEIAERFLPIGTIVKLKNVEKEIMIASYLVQPNDKFIGKNGPIESDKTLVVEYGGCYYPDGYHDTNRVLAFNHNQIEKVVFMGYETESSKNFSNMANKLVEEFKDNFEIVNFEELYKETPNNTQDNQEKSEDQ